MNHSSNMRWSCQLLLQLIDLQCYLDEWWLFTLPSLLLLTYHLHWPMLHICYSWKPMFWDQWCLVEELYHKSPHTHRLFKTLEYQKLQPLFLLSNIARDSWACQHVSHPIHHDHFQNQKRDIKPWLHLGTWLINLILSFALLLIPVCIHPVKSRANHQHLHKRKSDK